MRISLFAPATTALFLAAGTLVAADEIGRSEYMTSCATCHGEDAKGAGPLAQLMTVPIPDLTTLSAGNDGTFPMLDVIMVIDGRTGVRGHGYPMPVWGSRFKAQADDVGEYAGEIEARGRVLSIAQFLASIQE